MEEQVVRAVDLMTEVAGRLGFEVARLWPQLVRLIWLKALFTGLIDLFIIGVGSATLLRAYRWYSTNHPSLFDDDAEPFRLVGVALVAGLVLLGLTLLPGILTTLFYPEATAVIELLGR